MTAALPPAIIRLCRDTARCEGLYRDLLEIARRKCGAGLAAFDRVLLAALATVPNPERALLHLTRYLDAALSPSGFLDDAVAQPRLLDAFMRISGTSSFLVDVLVRDAELFRWLVTSGVLAERKSRETMIAEARDTWDRFSVPARRVQALKRYQRRELLRIGARDVLAAPPLEVTVSELSWLADGIVQVLLAHSIKTVESRFGISLETPISVIALGKWGGAELNYSSDIDFMLLYGEDTLLPGGHGTHELAVKVVEYLVRALADVTGEGMFYRTDLRLRPDGAAGSTALSLQAALSYYASRGALWERQMLIKARAAAGDSTFGETVVSRLRPFSYPRSLAVAPSQLIADVRARLSARWNEADDVKHGRGGIRDIEFSVQTLQLLTGARHPESQVTGTCEAIDVLASRSVLSEAEREEMTKAYVTLRRVEHALQLEAFEQTHRLPQDADLLEELAWKLGYAHANQFKTCLSAIRADAARLADAVFSPAAGGETAVTGSPFLIPDAGELAASGFRDAVATQRIFRLLAEGRGAHPHGHAFRARLETLLPSLVREAAEEALPDQALRALDMLMDQSPAPATVTACLEHARSRRLLLRLASAAPALLRSLAPSPLVLECLFSGADGNAADEFDTASLKQLREAEATASYLFGDSDIARYARVLSDTADETLRRVLQAEASGSPFVVLALGKYGGRELAPGSDLDLVFLFREDAGFHSDDAQHLARAVIQGLAAPAGTRRLYEVDARLRPEGKNSPIATSLSSYQRYFDGRASLWEHQSLLKARVAGGDPVLARETEHLIENILGALRFHTGMAGEIASMRKRMEPANRFRNPEFFDLKLSSGGLADAEFAVQMLQLATMDGSAAVRERNTFNALRMCAARADALAGTLREIEAAYRYFRKIQVLLRLAFETPSNLLPDDAADLARLNGESNEEVFRQSVRDQRGRMRAGFERIAIHLTEH